LKKTTAESFPKWMKNLINKFKSPENSKQEKKKKKTVFSKIMRREQNAHTKGTNLKATGQKKTHLKKATILLTANFSRATTVARKQHDSISQVLQ